jgi:hypothetical protein
MLWCSPYPRSHNGWPIPDAEQKSNLACVQTPATLCRKPITLYHASESQKGVRMAFPLPTLDILQKMSIATPCTVPWDDMQGDDRTRFCDQCRKRVFDLSSLTTAEATELMADQNNLPCVRLFRRPDGRVMTTDCPVALRARIWRRLRRNSSRIASLFAMLFLPSCQSVTQGVMIPEDSHLADECYTAIPPDLDPSQSDAKVPSSPIKDIP